MRMGLYEGIKDVARVVQQADNVELYRQLLELCSQALDMQAEIERLKEENKELRKKNDISEQIIRHKESYITISGNNKDLYYCSHCWDSIEKLIQLNCNENGTFECPHCHMQGTYDLELRKTIAKTNAAAIAAANSKSRRKSYWDM